MAATMVESTDPEWSNSHSRPRASTACATCRLRRTKCEISPGSNSCNYCQRHEILCVITKEDKRRRPISKAYVASLQKRIKDLETAALQPTTDAPEHTQQPPQEEQRASRSGSHAALDSVMNDHEDTINLGAPSPKPRSPAAETDEATTTSPENEDTLTRILSTSGNISSQQADGHVRYFGHTTPYHVFAGNDRPSYGSNLWDQRTRAEVIIRSIPKTTHDYLMQLYWTNYNSVLQVVHQEAFENGRDTSRWTFYGGFLHICLLAVGFRYADNSRPDLKPFVSGGRNPENSFHTEARQLAKCELETTGGLTSIQALLLLADLEGTSGRDNNGWMYAGMATRLAIDIGLNLQVAPQGMSARDTRIRHMVLCACLTFDRLWALHLGRPTALKASDVAVTRLTPIFDRSEECNVQEGSLEMQIYEALIELMALAGKVSDGVVSSDQPFGPRLLEAAALEDQFRAWYASLPSQLKWSKENCQNSPAGFFLLHQQYHATLILLHRPFARYEKAHRSHDSTQDQDHLADRDTFPTVSRRICYKNAISVAKTFELYQHRFNCGQFLHTGLHHAATATVALVASVSSLNDATEVKEAVYHLQILLNVLRAVACYNRIAQRISISLHSLLKQHGWAVDADERMGESHSAMPMGPAPSLADVAKGGRDFNASARFGQQPCPPLPALRATSDVDSVDQHTTANVRGPRPQPKAKQTTLSMANGQDYSMSTSVTFADTFGDGFGFETSLMHDDDSFALDIGDFLSSLPDEASFSALG